MKKILKFAGFVCLLMGLFYLGSLIADRYALRNDIIRLHVVADSDSDYDQKAKLAVRDAVISYLNREIPVVSGAKEATRILADRLPDLETVANDALMRYGSADRVDVSLCEEAFGLRQYSTFSLPSGIYHSLRIEIGSGQGKNWWCVAFPSLCTPTTTGEFVEAAVSSGLDPELSGALSQDNTYEVRFFLLDLIGKIENFFFIS